MAIKQDLRSGDVRRAKLDDIEQLLIICKHCFPKTLRWQGSKTAAQLWWKSAINSEAVEIWVVDQDGQIGACLVLVVKESLWAAEKPLRRGLIPLLFAAFLHPCILSRYLRQIGCHTLKKIFDVLFHKQRISKQNPRSRTWLELIAVNPDKRRCGIGSELLEFCEERTVQLNREAIVLLVDSDNVPAKSLYEKRSYMRLWSDRYKDAYVKSLGKY